MERAGSGDADRWRMGETVKVYVLIVEAHEIVDSSPRALGVGDGKWMPWNVYSTREKAEHVARRWPVRMLSPAIHEMEVVNE